MSDGDQLNVRFRGKLMGVAGRAPVRVALAELRPFANARGLIVRREQGEWRLREPDFLEQAAMRSRAARLKRRRDQWRRG